MADRHRVAIVDDDPDIGLLFRVGLRLAGHDAVALPDPDDPATWPPVDVVVVGLRPPARSGLDLLRAITLHQPHARLVVSTATTWGAGDELSALADAVLVRPHTNDELVEAVGAGALALPAV